ncbi:MAG: HlyD family efflux transporter periplasmic adaptor subunit [Anaerolineales bacterium]|jgi:multidrug efflux pump subunit AcrA (membrane-fusion protein)
MKITLDKKIRFLAMWMIVIAIVISGCSNDNANAAATQTEDPFEDFIPIIAATGKIVPHDRATLSVPTGGIVDELLVEENDKVKSGTILLVLSGVKQMEAAVAAAKLELLSAQQALDDLLLYSDVTSAEAQQTLARANNEVRDAEVTVSSLKNPGTKDEVNAAYASLILAADKLDKVENLYKRVKNKPKDNLKRAEAEVALDAASDVYDAALRRYNYLSGSANEYDIAIGEADLVWAQAMAEVAQAELEKIGDGPDPDELAIAQARLENAQAQFDSASAALEDMRLKAPFNGIVSQIFVRENEWVTPGTPVIAFGDFTNLHVETTDLNEIDVTRIEVGSRATITFDALPEIVVDATVVSIASKSSPGSGVNYTVILEFDEIPEGLLWDMTAFVDIQIEE